MAPLPSRLLGQTAGNFFVFDPRAHQVTRFDIISYTWGETIEPHECGIEGVDWNVVIRPQKLQEIKNFMIHAAIPYMWVDCVCINQNNETEKAAEIAKMYEYYKQADRCHILIDMDQVWNPRQILKDLRYLNHILVTMTGASLASASHLGQDINNFLANWETVEWTFAIDKETSESAGIELGVLNCYSTCISHVRSLFHNLYFSRVWTFQEMLLGKNITMWGTNGKEISSIGELGTWMELSRDSQDKAYKLEAWIEGCRVLKMELIEMILMVIKDDQLSLDGLQTQVKGVDSARTDIVNGGAQWWRQNHQGVSNVFSAISIIPRNCGNKADIFRGLLGVFSGLFTAEEVESDLGGEDIEQISFAFFRKLSIETTQAWTKLAVSSEQRGEWDWIPVVANHSKLMTTDVFAGVINLGPMKQKKRALAKATALTGIGKTPRKYMRLQLHHVHNREFEFVFKGCNCGRNIKTGMFSSEQIATNNTPTAVPWDLTGRTLVQCATILGSILDPGCNLLEYRRRFLQKLRPFWKITDPTAKPPGWIERCVNGTAWENPSLRPHNLSMNWRMVGITDCGSRLENDSTSNISCEVTINCGCKIIAPFSWIFEAITSVEGSSLGDTTARLDKSNRIILQDGMGLVQVGDINKTFNIVAFGGDVGFHKEHGAKCRNTREDRGFSLKKFAPSGRAIVPEEFEHGAMNMMRDYGYVPTGGSGNLLICRNQPFGQYKIVGVCIDENIPTKKAQHAVSIR